MNKRFNSVLAACGLFLALGVSAHANEVQGVSPADLALAKQVQRAVLQAAPFQDQGVEVDVRVEAGKVSLTGWVGYESDEHLARQIALSTPGVQSVSSHFHSWSSSQR
jgi:osmotically-inducible protein OsmY